MAVEATIGGEGALFVGEDKQFVLGPVLDASGVPVDISSWTIIFVIALTDKGAALFNLSASIVGSYNATVALNTQRAVATLTSAQMDTLAGRTYRHSWKRTTSGLETILAYGDFVVEKATAP